MKVGDLVKVVAPGLRPLTDSLGIVIEMEPRSGTYGGTVPYCRVNMAATQEIYKYRVEHLDVIS